MGSVLALARALRSLGTTVDAVLAGPVDRSIRGLALEGEALLTGNLCLW